VSDLLRQYPYVKSFEFLDMDTMLRITFTDGRERNVLVTSFKPTRESSAKQLRQNAEEYRKRAIDRAQKVKRRLETTLRADGLVVVYSTPGLVHIYSAEDKAHERLRALCVALHETTRHKEEIRRALLDLPTPESSDCAWEIFLNLRHRELWQRLRKDGIE